MTIVKSYPPNYDAIKERFPVVTGRSTVVFAHHPNIHAPSGNRLPPEIIAHEQVHMVRQQLVGVDAWWERYLHDTEFRFHEELLAHRAEYQCLAQQGMNRQMRRHNLKAMIKKFQHPIYDWKMRMDEQTLADVISKDIDTVSKMLLGNEEG